MTTFLLKRPGLIRVIQLAWQDPSFRVLALLAGGVLSIGTVFFHLVEGWRWLDSPYICVMTLATVGYGDFTPKTDPGKIFAMLYVFIGIGLLFAVFTRIADALLAARQAGLEKQSKETE